MLRTHKTPQDLGAVLCSGPQLMGMTESGINDYSKESEKELAEPSKSTKSDLEFKGIYPAAGQKCDKVLGMGTFPNREMEPGRVHFSE